VGSRCAFFWFIRDRTFSVADVFRGWERALRDLGNTVKTYNTNDRLSFYAGAMLPDYSFPEDTLGGRPLKKAMTSEQAMQAAMQGLSHELYTFAPHVVMFVSAFYTAATTLQVIRAHGTKVVILHTESPYQDDEQLIRAQHATVNLINDPANLEDYKALCPKSYYMPHAYDPTVHYPRNVLDPVVADFSFIGTMFKSRKEFFESLFEHLDPWERHAYRIALGGAGFDNEFMDGSPLLKYLGHPRGECVDNSETANSYRSSRSGINFYRRESEGEHSGEGWACGPREIEMAACGLPFIRDPRPESDELFGNILPSFDGPADAAEKLRWLLAEENRRVRLGARALMAIEDRTFENNAKFLMKKLEK
jgi:spore maturation protein CgeB